MHTVRTLIRSRKKHTARVDKKRLLIRGGLALLAVLMLIQIFYPSNRLLPFTTIDGRSFAFQTRSDTTKQLNTAYKNHTVNIYMGIESKPVTSPKLSVADITVDNTERINKLDYPWYLRLVPTSLFWAGLKQTSPPKPVFGNTFDDYVNKSLMPSCQEQPIDATLKVSGDTLELVKAESGGQCAANEVIDSIKKVAPVIGKSSSIRVNRKELPPELDDAAAQKKATELNARLKNGVTIVANGQPVIVQAKDILGWLDFATKDKALAATVNADKAATWLAAQVSPKIAVKPGISYVITKDFTETSRQNGAPGKALDMKATVDEVQAVVDGGKPSANAIAKDVPPVEQYTRTYSASDAGLSALMANYAKDHPGSYGISMIELDGKKRRASYNGDKQFVTASTYKLFVAYSLMKQIDAGKRDWDSNAACFNKMISLSDNACAESFLNSLGLKTVSDDIQAIGMKNSTFMKSGGPYTTANDLTLELGMIATGQNFSSANQQRLISAMKANVFRKGIPAGVNGTVADKVGFMNGLLHDAAIVYSPSGTYVLAIMTDGSSWETIADLAKQLDTLHAQ